jgi:hypothetical protein
MRFSQGFLDTGAVDVDFSRGESHLSSPKTHVNSNHSSLKT